MKSIRGRLRRQEKAKQGKSLEFDTKQHGETQSFTLGYRVVNIQHFPRVEMGCGGGGNNEKFGGHCAPSACGLAPEGSGKGNYSDDSKVLIILDAGEQQGSFKRKLKLFLRKLACLRGRFWSLSLSVCSVAPDHPQRRVQSPW